MMMEWGDYQRTLMVVIEHQWEFFARFRRSWRDFVGWVPVFSIDHVRSWKHDVWGCGQRMGGHHFMSLFTLSPSHIELPVASPLSLTRAHSLFFHHLIYLLRRVRDLVVLACYVWIRHEFQTWHTYSSLTLHSSLWYFPLGHHFITIFLISYITTCDIRSLSFLSSLVTQHYPCFSLNDGFSHATAWRIVTFLPRSPYGQWSRDLIWEVVLLVRIHVTSVHGES